MKNSINSFSVSCICSIIIHLLIIYFFLFGIPSLVEKLPEEQIITFEILPLDKISNVRPKIKQPEKLLENEVAKKVVQKKTATTPEKKDDPIEKKPEPLEKKDDPIEKKPEPLEKKDDPIEKKPEPLEKKDEPIEKKLEPLEKKDDPIEKKPEPLEKKDDPIEKKLEPLEKKDDPIEKKPEPLEKKDDPIEKKPEPLEKKNEPIEKKPVDKKKMVNKSDLDSLLKNLEQSSEGNNPKSAKKARLQETTETHESKGPYDETLSLSLSEISLIKQQIEKHWNIPIGVQNIERARVILYIAFQQDGSIQEVTVKEAICPNMSSNACTALSDSAVRAVWQASPIRNLTPERYDIWKEFNFDFNPSKIMR